MTVTEATRTIVLPSGEHIPMLGQGTWHMAENPLNRTNEINALLEMPAPCASRS